MMMSEVRFILDQHAELEFYSAISLKQQSDLSEKETIGFWVCPTCRELPRTVLKISEQLDAVIKNNMDLVRDTAAKIVRIHELEAENKRLRDSVKSISINNQDTEIHIYEEVHLSTSTPTANNDVRKPKGTLLIGGSIIRDINKRRFECDTDPMCIRGGKVNDISYETTPLHRVRHPPGCRWRV
jgi:hypothetical protein